MFHILPRPSRGHHQEFLPFSQEVAAPGDLRQVQTFDLMFKNVEKQYESTWASMYFVLITISRRMADVVKERDIWVHSFCMPPDSNNSIKMEVGIEDCLYIKFGCNKLKYHLKDVIVGKIYLLLVRIKIKHMELSIICRKTTGSPSNQYNESESEMITKFEIMDGAYPILFPSVKILLFLLTLSLPPPFIRKNLPR
ncbi:vacuolar protein sorting-associated protein 26-domain-containing protein [Lactarius hatsudake]|nr:vacuolar protein sorting-associated protein 26-domain-containing protein [Lactarius hatsudake]